VVLVCARDADATEVILVVMVFVIVILVQFVLVVPMEVLLLLLVLGWWCCFCDTGCICAVVCVCECRVLVSLLKVVVVVDLCGCFRTVGGFFVVDYPRPRLCCVGMHYIVVCCFVEIHVIGCFMVVRCVDATFYAQLGILSVFCVGLLVVVVVVLWIVDVGAIVVGDRDIRAGVRVRHTRAVWRC